MAVVASGCMHARNSLSVPDVNAPWRGFGHPGTGSIAIIIDGEVKYPGTYYLENRQNLDSILTVFGGWSSSAEAGYLPLSVTLHREQSGRTNIHEYFFRKQMSAKHRMAVGLRDGDKLTFNRIVW